MTAALEDHVAIGTWRALAACSESPPELFFLRPGGYRDQQLDAMTALARTVCATCPVRVPCGAEADVDELQGMWAGVYRYFVNGGKYRWIKLLAGVPDPQVTPRGRR